MALINRQFMPARHVELGQIKIGRKGAKTRSAGGNEFQRPERLSHFVVTTMERDNNDNYLQDQRIHGLVGEKPMELDGFLMFPEIEENFLSEMAEWQGRTKKVWVCDGMSGTNLTTGETGIPCRCANMARGVKRPCKPYMRLHLQLLASGTSLGYHVFRSTSYRTTNQIQTTLEEIERRCGTLFMAPVRLSCFYTQDRYMDGKKERTGKSLKVALTLRMPIMEALQVMNAHRDALTNALNQNVRLLSPLSVEARDVVHNLDDSDKKDERGIAQEFAPTDEDIQASIKTQEVVEGLVTDFVEGEWEEEEKVEQQPPQNITREEAEESFKAALDEAKLRFRGVINAWVAADEVVPKDFPTAWTIDHFLYATEAVRERGGVRFLIPFLFQRMESLPEALIPPIRERASKEDYTRERCDFDIREVNAYRKANNL